MDTNALYNYHGRLASAASSASYFVELRKTLLKYKLHTDQDLFDRAYAYIKQYN
jgi:type I restriction enzyme R subunit